MITALIRTVILYLLLIVGLRLTGKRQIGELEPIELVLAMLLSDLSSPRSPPSVGTTWWSQKGLALGLKALTAPPLC